MADQVAQGGAGGKKGVQGGLGFGADKDVAGDRRRETEATSGTTEDVTKEREEADYEECQG